MRGHFFLLSDRPPPMGQAGQVVAGVFVGVGMIGIVFGSLVAFDAWATIKEIEALGLLGQAAFEESYRDRLNILKWALTAVVIGFASLVFGFGLAISDRLDDRG